MEQPAKPLQIPNILFGRFGQSGTDAKKSSYPVGKTKRRGRNHIVDAGCRRSNSVGRQIPAASLYLRFRQRTERRPVQFQPSEVTKVLLIVFYAGYLADHKSEITDFWKGFVKPLLFLLPPFAILFFVQNHLSVCIVIAAIVGVMMIAAGIRMLFVWATCGIGAVGVTGLLLIMQAKDSGGFTLSRILSFLDPWSDPTGDGWQVIQSFYAIGSGGLFGVGQRRK